MGSLSWYLCTVFLVCFILLLRLPRSTFTLPAYSNDGRLKMAVMQRPAEKRMMNREITLKERSSLTGIDIKIWKKRLTMKVESHRGEQISVFSSALQV